MPRKSIEHVPSPRLGKLLTDRALVSRRELAELARAWRERTWPEILRSSEPAPLPSLAAVARSMK